MPTIWSSTWFLFVTPATNDAPPVSSDAPTPCSGSLGQASHETRIAVSVETLEGETGDETPQSEAVMYGGSEISLGAPPPARAVTRLPNGQFPKRAPLCKPATREQFIKAVELMAEGSTFAVIRKAAGADWQAINEYGMQEYPQEWPAVNQAWRESRALALVDKATDIAMQTSPASVSETDGAMGRSVTRLHKTDPGMLTAALAGLLPQIHGRAAGRGTVNVTANNAAIYAPVQPGTLSDWVPEGLTP